MRHYLASLDPALSKLRHLAAMGGSGGDIPPLSRESFIDNGSLGGTGDGFIGSPFKTITGWVTAKATPRVSDADALRSQVGLLCQSIADYATEAVAFPPYASTELKGLASPASSAGISIESLTWNNVAGAHAPAAALGMLTDVSVATGGVTYTDDVGAPLSEIILTSGYGSQMQIAGGITATGTHSLEGVACVGPAIFGAVDISAELIAFGGTTFASGTIACTGLVADDAGFAVTTIDLSAGASILNCQFESQMVLSCSTTDPVNMDGPSLHSFLGSGSTFGAGTIVTALGGYDACPYEGPNGLLPAAGDAVISIDGQAAGTTQADGGNSYFVAPTAAHAVQIKNSGENALDTICISKTNSAADAAYSIKNNAGAVVAVIPAGAMGFVVMQKKGADWEPIRSGSGVTV
jgi:hypothetical protein